jgi:hypothetical protein
VDERPLWVDWEANPQADWRERLHGFECKIYRADLGPGDD